jgi:hypothetical protein
MMDDILKKGEICMPSSNKDRFQYVDIKKILAEYREVTYTDLKAFNQSQFMSELNRFGSKDYILMFRKDRVYIKVYC